MNDNSFNLPQEDINFGKIFKILIRNIWLFVIFGMLSLGLAYIYVFYSVPIYKISTSILIKEDNSQPFSSSGMDNMFSGNLFGGKKNLVNELIIIKSNPIIGRAIKNLDLEVAYYEFKKHQYHNSYKKSPFKIVFFREHPQLLGATFNLHFNSDGSFNVFVEKNNVNVFDYSKNAKIASIEDFEINIKGSLGQVIESEYFKFIVQLSEEDLADFQNDNQFAFKLRTNKSLTRSYSNRLKFDIVDEDATVIEVSLLSNSIELGTDILNELTRVYQEANLAEKNHIANMTIGYIEEQLKEVSKSLNLAQDSLQRFLSKNQLVDVEDQASGMSGQLIELENGLAALMTQKRYFIYVGEYLEGNNEETQIIAPASMGIQDPLLNKLIMDLSTAQSSKANLVQNGQERNPIVQRLGIQIENLKSVVAENISSARNSNELSIVEMQKRINQLQGELRKLPKTQLQLGGIQRSFKLNDAIYNYLLQKHAEAKITKASNLPDNIIVAPADLKDDAPVSPNINKIYLIALLAALGIPSAILVLIMLLKQKIETREDLEKITNAPILGTILHNRNKKENNVFKDRPQSNIAESYRSLRTNINFNLKNKDNKVILVTSTVAGEGKSYSALNMASSYAGLGLKTVLVNCDMRKATKVIETINSKIGLSTHLSGKSSIKDIITTGYMENLDYISPGAIPPNPMELIASSKTNELMNYLKGNYSIIILDSTPLAQVTDAYNLVQFSDISLIVTRYKYTDKKILRLVLKELKNKDIENVALILNDNRITNEQYGYGYGYYEK